MSKEKEIYHEQQSLQLCALHALNNLFQKQILTKADLDKICIDLTPQTWFNPHKSALGIGNYDINVIMGALQQRGFEAKWFDKRRYDFKSEFSPTIWPFWITDIRSAEYFLTRKKSFFKRKKAL